MSPSLRVLSNAFVLTLGLAAFVAAPASAQFYDATMRSVGLSNELARSPRLLGMGRLSLVVPEKYNALTLWDFAGDAAGIATSDSVSTLDIWPGTSSASGAHDEPTGYRQDLGARGTNVRFETFRRDGEGNAFGLVGITNSITSATPYASDEVIQRQVGQPDLMPVMTGKLPYFGGGKMHYALRLRFGGEHVVDHYKAITTNAGGDFLTLDGVTLDPPNSFTPDEYRVNTSGLGGSLAYPIGKRHTLAFGIDGVRQIIKGSNDGFRYGSEITERRPYGVGHVTLVGKLGKSFEYGLDDHAWTSQSEQKWVFSISAGVGSFPLDGRGKYQTRDEKGNAFNGRFRWSQGKMSLAGQFWTSASKTNYDAPSLSDRSSFNYFLDQLWYRTGTDTLARPDSVVSSRQRDYAFGYGAGVGYQVGKGTWGLEYHWSREMHISDLNGDGPKPLQWDVRTGMEYPCSKVLTSRIGYAYRWVDRDDLVAQTEYLGHTVTGGLGLKPAGASWTFELGYAIELQRSDFGDPSKARSSRQDLAAQIHFGF